MLIVESIETGWRYPVPPIAQSDPVGFAESVGAGVVHDMTRRRMWRRDTLGRWHEVGPDRRGRWYWLRGAPLPDVA